MIKKSLFFTLLSLLLLTSLFSQGFEYDIQLVDTSSIKQSTPDIVFCQDSTIFVTWEAYFPVFQKRIFCAKSTNNGVGFLPPVEPDPSFATKLSPRVDADAAGNPNIVWSDYRTGEVNIRFAKSTDGGSSFLQSKIVYSQDTLNLGPQVKVSMNGQKVFIAWITLYGDTVNQDSSKLFFSRSTDGGVNFLPAQHIGGITDTLQYLFSFDISENGDTVALVWEDHSPPKPILKYSFSTDSGVNFSIPAVVDSMPGSHFSPSLSLFKDSTFIVYTDDGLGNWDIKMASCKISNTPTFSYVYVDSDTFVQEQPSLDIDKQGNFYVSFRSEECQFKAMTYVALGKKGNPLFFEDWVGIFGFGNTDSRIAVKDTANFFITWEWHFADTSLTVFARSVPAAPPGPPQYLLANGGNPSPWDTTTKFNITFIKPYDPSGIYKVLLKLGSSPTSNFDTTAAFNDTSSTDTCVFTVRDTIEGGDPLFVWLMDGKGNLDYNNNSSVLLRCDTTPPSPTEKIMPDSGSVVNVRQPLFLWHPSIDLGGSGILTYVLVLDTTAAIDSLSQFYFVGLDTSIQVPVPLWDDVYYWTVIPYDSAGNWQTNVTVWNFLERATPPPVPITPPDSGWVAKNFLLRWHTIPDTLAYVDKYFVTIATDSQFNNIVFNGSTSGPQDTLMLISNWNVGNAFWHVRARNKYGVYTLWSQRMFFRYDTIPPPSPTLSSPADSLITNNPRPTFYWHPVTDSQSGVQNYIIAVFSDSTLYDTVFIFQTPDTFSTPSSNLPDGNLYWLVLARDRANNVCSPSDTFLLIVDTQSPIVNTVIPSDGQVGVSVSSNIIVAFNESMDTSSINDTTFTVIDNLSHRYYGTFNFNSSVDQLTFNPNENFYGGRSILVTVKKDVMDLAQNKMGSDYTWQFITESVNDSTGPVVYNLSLIPDTVYLGQNILVNATVSDSENGNSMVVGCELFIDSIGTDSTGEMFIPLDDSFDYITEDVIDTLKTGSIPYKTTHRVYVHGLDVEGNWGVFDSLSFWVMDTLPPNIDATVSPDPAYLGKDFTIKVTSNKSLMGIDSCYIIDSYNNSVDVTMDRDSLDTDSTYFSKSLTLSGLEPGSATLYADGRDLYNKVGRDSVKFSIAAEGEFLPKKKVYTWPNPGQDEVHFRFYVNRNAKVTINIFTITGRRITTLTGNANGGDQKSEIKWNTKNVGSDLYIFRLKAQSINSPDKSTVMKKFAIVK